MLIRSSTPAAIAALVILFSLFGNPRSEARIAPFSSQAKHLGSAPISQAGSQVFTSHYLELHRYEIANDPSSRRLGQLFNLSWGQAFPAVEATLETKGFYLTQPQAIFQSKWQLPDWEYQYWNGERTDHSWSSASDLKLVFYMFLKADAEELLVVVAHTEHGLFRIFHHAHGGAVTVLQKSETVRRVSSETLRESTIAEYNHWYSNGPPSFHRAKTVDPMEFLQGLGGIFPNFKQFFERSIDEGGFVHSPDHSWRVGGRTYYIVVEEDPRITDDFKPVWSVFEYGESGLRAVHSHDRRWVRTVFRPLPKPTCKLWFTPDFFERTADVQLSWDASREAQQLLLEKLLYSPPPGSPLDQIPTTEDQILDEAQGSLNVFLEATSSYKLTVQNETGSSTCFATAVRKSLQQPPLSSDLLSQDQLKLLVAFGLFMLILTGALQLGRAWRRNARRRREAKKQAFSEKLSQLDFLLEERMLDDAELYLQELLSEHPEERLSVLQGRQRILDAREAERAQEAAHWDDLLDDYTQGVEGDRIQPPNSRRRPPRK